MLNKHVTILGYFFVSSFIGVLPARSTYHVIPIVSQVVSSSHPMASSPEQPTVSEKPILSMNVAEGHHFIRANASGSADGTDWTNAYSSLPEDLIRGDVYYIADGVYSGYHFDDPGSSLITIKKATRDDHGTEVGWQSEYGDGAAQFGGISFSGSNYVFDGQIGGGPGSWKTGHGFEIYITGGEGIYLDGSPQNITIRHVEIHSPSLNTIATGIKGTTGSPGNITLSHSFVHTFLGPHFHAGSWDQAIIEYNFFGENNSTPEWHSEFWSDLGCDNIKFRYNIFEHIDGTAVFAGVNAGTSNNWEIYGNIFYQTTSPLLRFYYEEGASSNKSSAYNFKIYNNTVIGPGNGMIVIDRGSGNEVKNNLWYRFQEPNNYLVMGGAANFQYNQYNDCDFRATSLDDTNITDATGDPFINYSNGGILAGDFHLRAPTSPGLPLSSPYDVDLSGWRRGNDGLWDMGAYEYGGSAQTFEDVPPGHWAYEYVEALYRGGYIVGCSLNPRRYCPEGILTRAEEAVFVVRGARGAEFTPLIPPQKIFEDATSTDWFYDWTAQLYEDGYTSGCWEDPLRYCPLRENTIAEGCVFFLRMREGVDYRPIEQFRGLFADVPSGAWYAGWVEACYDEGILLPCRTESALHACPELPLDRALGAYMMFQAKQLTLP